MKDNSRFFLAIDLQKRIVKEDVFHRRDGTVTKINKKKNARFRYLFKKTHNVIYNVIGVLPEHQMSGLAIALIHKSILMRQEKYPYGVSSFILEDNVPSTKICRKLSTGINKEYHLYEISGDDSV